MKSLVKVLVLLLVICGSLCWAGNVQADTGVGVMPGTIWVDDPLSPGQVYQLTSIQVLNTGTEPGEYEVELAYMEDQEELQAPEEYISFSPRSFYLEPGDNQVVALSLNIPIKATPGDYLNRVQAHPVAAGSGTSIGVAAATKLYFTVRPANVWVGMVYSVTGFFVRNAPVSYIVPSAIALVLLIIFLRRHIKLEVRRVN